MLINSISGLRGTVEVRECIKEIDQKLDINDAYHFQYAIQKSIQEDEGFALFSLLENFPTKLYQTSNNKIHVCYLTEFGVVFNDPNFMERVFQKYKETYTILMPK